MSYQVSSTGTLLVGVNGKFSALQALNSVEIFQCVRIIYLLSPKIWSRLRAHIVHLVTYCTYCTVLTFLLYTTDNLGRFS